jgi:hypothetical protein
MTPPVNLLPAIYLDADVRNVTPVCPGRKRLGLGLDIPGQPTVRVSITLEHAQFLRDSLNDYISASAGCQRPMSELMPNLSSTVPSEVE